MDLDELLATKLVTFMMEHHSTIFLVPAKLRRQVEEHLSHLKRVQVCTRGEMDEFIFVINFPPSLLAQTSNANVSKISIFLLCPTGKYMSHLVIMVLIAVLTTSGSCCASRQPLICTGTH